MLITTKDKDRKIVLLYSIKYLVGSDKCVVGCNNNTGGVNNLI